VYLMPPSAILRGAQQIYNVEVSVSTRWLTNIPSSQKRSSPSWEMFVTRHVAGGARPNKNGTGPNWSAKCLMYSSSVDTAL
jgi:hypothetical protein